MLTQWKYTNKSQGRNPNTNKGRRINPNNWITGPNELRREKYYAWMKHRAQATFRDEDYDLSFEDWEKFWPDDLFLRRGRTKKSLVLTRLNFDQGWCVANCEISDRSEAIRRSTSRTRT